MTYESSEVWCAAAAAWRINGNRYIKSVGITEDEIHKIGNSPLILKLLTTYRDQITDADIELGKAAQKRVGREYARRLLSDDKLSQFEQDVAKALAINTFDLTNRLEISLIAFQIKYYFDLLEQREVLRSLRDEHCGDVGERLRTKVTVVKSYYSYQYGTAFITARTQDGYLISFAYRTTFDANINLDISGTVKRHGNNDSTYGVRSTQLNRVKVFNEV